MSLFLLTCHNAEERFMETLINTKNVVTIRLLQDDEFRMHIEDTNNNNFSARFATEESLRARLKELLHTMGSDTTVADTMKITKISSVREEISNKLDELLKKL